MPEPPSRVLDRFQQGDLSAFESFFREPQRSVYGWILRIVRDPAAAEDLTVESFWRIHRAHVCFQSARPFVPWARRIATRAALDFLRDARKGESLDLIVPDLIVPDLIVVDPPRTGLGADVTALLGQIAAPAMVYVSCDPATLARDPHALIGAGYAIEHITLADLFPQTFHLETVVRLQR